VLQLVFPQLYQARGVKHVGARQGFSRRQSNRVQTDEAILALGCGFLVISQRSPERLRHPVRLGDAALYLIWLPVGPLTVLAAVNHDAASGAGRELVGACTSFNAAAVATCLDLGSGDLFLLGRFSGRLDRYSVDVDAEEAIEKSTGEIFFFMIDTPVGLGVIGFLTQ
jgi:hypothetical protein